MFGMGTGVTPPLQSPEFLVASGQSSVASNYLFSLATGD